MKIKLLSLLFLMFTSGKVTAQYSPLLTDNPSWIVQVYDFLWSGNYTIYQGNDVVVGTHTYKKFVDPFLGNMEFLLREDVATKKIYKIVNDTEILLFDFSLNLSDEVTLSNGLQYVVTAVNTINVNGGQRKQLILQAPESSPFWDEIWVEGVGSRKHPLFAEHELFSDPVYALRCSFQNGENVYNQGLANGGTSTDCVALSVETPNYLSSKISFAPNPFQTELTIATELILNDSTIKMYNSIGQLVKEINHLNGNKISLDRGNLNDGFYFIQLIENGKLLASKKILIAD